MENPDTNGNWKPCAPEFEGGFSPDQLSAASEQPVGTSTVSESSGRHFYSFRIIRWIGCSPSLYARRVSLSDPRKADCVCLLL